MRELDFGALRTRLLHGGIAPKHVKRTLKELRHHLADLEQKAVSEGLPQAEASALAAEQLGDPELIIAEALARSELRSCSHRWPWAIYGLFPVLTLVLAFVGSIIAVAGTLALAEAYSGLSPEAFANAVFEQWWARVFFEIWPIAMVYVLPSVTSGGLCILAARRDAPILWPAIGVFLVLLLGFCYNLSVNPPPAPDQLARFGAGVGFSFGRLFSIQGLRLLIPLVLVLGTYYGWRNAQELRDTPVAP